MAQRFVAHGPTCVYNVIADMVEAMALDAASYMKSLAMATTTKREGNNHGTR